MEPSNDFLWMFPLFHLRKITEATTVRDQQKALKDTSVGGILKFFGTLVFMTRVGFSERRSLRGSKPSNSTRVQKVDLLSEMSGHRCEELVVHTLFSVINNPKLVIGCARQRDLCAQLITEEISSSKVISCLGIMLTLEITKSEAETAERAYEDTHAHSTAVILQLVEPWFNFGRHESVNSYFSSVPTGFEAMECGTVLPRYRQDCDLLLSNKAPF